MQCHSPTKVPRQVTPITTFRSNKCFDAQQVSSLSHCYFVVLSRCSWITWELLWPKVQTGSSSLWSLSFNYATSSSDPCAWPAFFDDMWNSAIGENRTRLWSHFPIRERPITKALEKQFATLSLRSFARFACCSRFFAARKATSGKRWSVRDKRFLSLSFALSILPSLANLSSHRSSKNG